jgi:hypothetical protein
MVVLDMGMMRIAREVVVLGFASIHSIDLSK